MKHANQNQKLTAQGLLEKMAYHDRQVGILLDISIHTKDPSAIAEIARKIGHEIIERDCVLAPQLALQSAMEAYNG